MPRLLSKRLLDEARVAARPMPDSVAAAIVRSLLLTSGDGILVTDLEHRSLACNRQFGELFQVPPDRVVEMEPEALRRKVYPRLRDPEAWRAHLERVYAHPEQTHEDELELLGDHPRTLLRSTGPVQLPGGEIVGRLWRFRDLTPERRRERMSRELVEVSTCREPDPASACRLIVRRLAAFYDATAILSIRHGDVMVFRELAGMPLPLSWVRSNKLKDSFCQIALRSVEPLLIQDAREHPELKDIPPARLGFRRYLGVPVYDHLGQSIGTLCIMDGRSEQPLLSDDEQFLAMLAMRVSVELDRERLYQERTAEQRTALARQQRELAETHQVLEAMNGAFAMLGRDTSIDGLVEAQARLLGGLMGYPAAALLVPANGEGALEGWHAVAGAKPRRVRLSADGDPFVRAVRNHRADTGSVEVRFEHGAHGPLAKLLGRPFLAVVSVPRGREAPALLVFGTDVPPEFGEARHRTHLEALADQVSLLLTTHALQARLRGAHEELRATYDRLHQSEKLSVVGTLAASVAHDIRNIVSSLSLECSLGAADPHTALANVRKQLDRFALLAHRLLSYARPRLLSREPADLRELLERAIGLTDVQARASGVRLAVIAPGHKVEALADANQAEHLFINLVLNAIQALSPEGGEVRVSLLAERGGTAVEVADNGPGIPEHQAERLFEPFASTRVDGFGLGLYSCRRIADEHGWKLTVQTQPGKGTTFRVWIPGEEA